MLVNNGAGEQRVPKAAEAVHMLMSMLQVYPSVGSARLHSGQTSLDLEFYLRRKVSSAQFEQFASDVKQAYAVWDLAQGETHSGVEVFRAAGHLGAEAVPLVSRDPHRRPLEKLDPDVAYCEIDSEILERMRPRDFREYWNGLILAVECFVVRVEVAKFTRDEMEMLVALVGETWGEFLVKGVNVGMDEDRILFESDSFNACLEALKTELTYNGSAAQAAELLAYRDEARVLVGIPHSDMVPAGVNKTSV